MRKALIPLAIILTIAAVAFAQISPDLSVSGRLTDSTTGAPLNGNFDITFKIFDDAISGTQLHENVQANLQVTNGLFQTILDTSLDSLAFDKDYWLELNVSGEVLSPRQKLTPAPYAIYANRAGSSDSADSLGNGVITVLGSNVGIGTANPTEALDVNGNVKVNGSIILAAEEGLTIGGLTIARTPVPGLPLFALDGINVAGGTLEVSVQYCYQVTAIVGGVETRGTEECGPPGAGDNAINISWSALAGATSYKVYGRNQSDIANYPGFLGETSGLFFEDDGTTAPGTLLDTEGVRTDITGAGTISADMLSVSNISFSDGTSMSSSTGTCTLIGSCISPNAGIPADCTVQVPAQCLDQTPCQLRMEDDNDRLAFGWYNQLGVNWVATAACLSAAQSSFCNFKTGKQGDTFATPIIGLPTLGSALNDDTNGVETAPDMWVIRSTLNVEARLYVCGT